MKRAQESNELNCYKKRSECNRFEVEQIIQPRIGSRVLFSDVFKSLKCTVHRDFLNPKDENFFRRKGHFAKSLDYKDFYIDEKGYLLNFESIMNSESKRFKNESDIYHLIVSRNGLSTWVKDALESELVLFRSEIEIIKKTHYLYAEFNNEMSRRLMESPSLNDFFSEINFDLFRNICGDVE
jgi:hypothetical protein